MMTRAAAELTTEVVKVQPLKVTAGTTEAGLVAGVPQRCFPGAGVASGVTAVEVAEVTAEVTGAATDVTAEVTGAAAEVTAESCWAGAGDRGGGKASPGWWSGGSRRGGGRGGSGGDWRGR